MDNCQRYAEQLGAFTNAPYTRKTLMIWGGGTLIRAALLSEPQTSDQTKSIIMGKQAKLYYYDNEL